MKKIFHLSTCDTCKRIIKELDVPSDFELQDIKTEPISEKDMAEMHQRAGSYEALFSKRARLYKELGIKDQALTDEEFRPLIIEHYTFLKRPVIIVGDRQFVGNSKKVVAAARQAIHS